MEGPDSEANEEWHHPAERHHLHPSRPRHHAGLLHPQVLPAQIYVSSHAAIRCQMASTHRNKSSCIANILDISTKPTLLCSPSTLQSNMPNVTSLVLVSPKLAYLTVIYSLVGLHF